MTAEKLREALAGPRFAKVDNLRHGVGHIMTPLMSGDNLAILLCGHFDDPDQEPDDETGWTPAASEGCDEVLAAIHAHYAPEFNMALADLDVARAALDTQAARIAELEAALWEVEDTADSDRDIGYGSYQAIRAIVDRALQGGQHG